MPSKATTPKSEKASRKLLADSTYGKTSPAEQMMTSFAHTVLVFLEDWRDTRLTSDEVCETLFAAAIARKLVKPRKPAMPSMTIDEELTNLIHTAPIKAKP